MDTKILNKICKKVYAQFPEVRNVNPKIRPRLGSQSLLIFESKVTTENGFSIPRVVRVVADAEGNIIKMTTSR